MKTLIASLLLFSLASFSQTAPEQDIYASPNLVVSGTNFENLTDCWARIYERESFQGRTALLVGYTTWAQSLPEGWPAWTGNIGSVRVGPGARLILYGEPYFVDEDHTVTGGVSVRDLPEAPIGDRIESIKLLCDPT